ncbi:MAG: ferrochelatase, partial [Fimbriimonadaceae bacterium]|nr:ferrochelatase [Alphaproteobacteria bacterium]
MSAATTSPAHIGVLLINLGTPEATDYWSMRKYLKEFLSDPRVIEVNPLIWWPLLNGVILSVRPRKSGRNYDKIWNFERNESPLRTYTRAQADKLRKVLADSSQALKVDWAMRYGTPSINDKIAAMTSEGCDRILLFPLYPQYSA